MDGVDVTAWWQDLVAMMQWWHWAIAVVVLIAVLVALFAWIQARRRRGGVRTTRR